jgi:hypothetical protein
MSDPKQDEMRAQFEAWATANGYRVKWEPADDIAAAGYTSTITHHAWEGYQAAYRAASMRAAQVARSHLGGGNDGVIHFIAEAIEADVGIKGDGR